MKRNKLFVIFLCTVMMMFSFTMCKSKTMNTYNPYSERYGISSDEDLKKAMQSMKENEDYPIYKDGQEESKIHRQYLLDLYEKNDLSGIKTYIDNNKLILGKN
ncbi:hypothetical protein [Finegoldia magna]|uniref:hypothetical protein n=1 Tax=Finegoldia magna TaxID=1260 RepID=UPI00290A47E6|nr:hypothetical protein [Finegoldia magna]MDU5201253.1 hypothetical protein [Finegoldia magna]MDU6776057.1 hypothetical protein [Finegoldia magna]